MPKRTLYHLVNPSPWPLTTALSLLIFLIGLVCSFHQKEDAYKAIILGLINLILSIMFWVAEVVKESTVEKKHTTVVANGLRLGFILFIVSEAILFASFFAAFFYLGINPTMEMGNIFPPSQIPTVSPFGIALLNTLLLLTSGYFLSTAMLYMNFIKFIHGGNMKECPNFI